MTAFLVKLLIAVLNDPGVQKILGKLIGDAVNSAVGDLETKLTTQIGALPEEIVSGIGTVAVDTEQIVENVVAGLSGPLSVMPQQLGQQISAIPQQIGQQIAGLPQQIISGVLQGIPNILNPFK